MAAIAAAMGRRWVEGLAPGEGGSDMKRMTSLAIVGLLPLFGLAPVAGWGQDQQPFPTQKLPDSGSFDGKSADTNAQAQPAPQPQFQAQPDEGATAQASPAPVMPVYDAGQLDQMLAPIALYPDSLLTQILMASTFPIQVVEAERWIQDPGHAALRGDALVAALQPIQWDPSVKSLVPFPQILKLLNDRLDYTQSLGTAFANQQSDVMAQVQVLRAQAEANGKLTSTPQLAVAHQGPAIVIEPANPAVVYVPVYDPAVIYGTWAYAAYPPVFFEPPVGFFVGTVGVGIGFSVGFGIVGPLWGFGHPVWGERSIFINNEIYSRISFDHAAFVGGASWHHVGAVGFVGGFRPGAGFRPGPGFHGPAPGFRAAAAGIHGPVPRGGGPVARGGPARPGPAPRATYHPPAGRAAAPSRAPVAAHPAQAGRPAAPAARAAPAPRAAPASHGGGSNNKQHH
jgi:Protein of unknown function (DUF3300)